MYTLYFHWFLRYCACKFTDFHWKKTVWYSTDRGTVLLASRVALPVEIDTYLPKVYARNGRPKGWTILFRQKCYLGR